MGTIGEINLEDRLKITNYKTNLYRLYKFNDDVESRASNIINFFKVMEEKNIKIAHYDELIDYIRTFENITITLITVIVSSYNAYVKQKGANHMVKFYIPRKPNLKSGYTWDESNKKEKKMLKIIKDLNSDSTTMDLQPVKKRIRLRLNEIDGPNHRSFVLIGIIKDLEGQNLQKVVMLDMLRYLNGFNNLSSYGRNTLQIKLYRLELDMRLEIRIFESSRFGAVITVIDIMILDGVDKSVIKQTLRYALTKRNIIEDQIRLVYKEYLEYKQPEKEPSIDAITGKYINQLRDLMSSYIAKHVRTMAIIMVVEEAIDDGWESNQYVIKDIINHGLLFSRIDENRIRQKYSKYLTEEGTEEEQMGSKATNLVKLMCEFREQLPECMDHFTQTAALKVLIDEYVMTDERGIFLEKLTDFLKDHIKEMHTTILIALYEDLKQFDLNYRTLFVEFKDGEFKVFFNVDIKVIDDEIRFFSNVSESEEYNNLKLEFKTGQVGSIPLSNVKYWVHTTYGCEVKYDDSEFESRFKYVWDAINDRIKDISYAGLRTDIILDAIEKLSYNEYRTRIIKNILHKSRDLKYIDYSRLIKVVLRKHNITI